MDKSEIYDKLNRAYFSENCHEKDLLDALRNDWREAKCFIDIGASLGQFTYHANKCMDGGTIIAVEADPVRYEELQRNCTKWEGEGRNKVICVHGAVCKTSGTMSFFTTNSNISGGLTKRDVDADWQEIRVPAITLDELVEDHRPDVIKLDVEGAEMDVIQSGVKTLEKKPMFVIEVHGNVDTTKVASPQMLFSYMSDQNFEHINYWGKSIFSPQGSSFNLVNTAKRLQPGIVKRIVHFINHKLFGSSR